jgi:lysophospholipase L1-like esterase
MEGDLLNGAEHLTALLATHQHLDLLILYLGINDIFVDARLSVAAMEEELGRLIDNVRIARSPLPLLVLAPLPVNVSGEYHAYYHEQIEKSLGLIPAFERVSTRKGCHFLDPSRVISASRKDGVHIEAEEHVKLGLHLCAAVPRMCSSMDSAGA